MDAQRRKGKEVDTTALIICSIHCSTSTFDNLIRILSNELDSVINLPQSIYQKRAIGTHAIIILTESLSSMSLFKYPMNGIVLCCHLLNARSVFHSPPTNTGAPDQFHLTKQSMTGLISAKVV